MSSIPPSAIFSPTAARAAASAAKDWSYIDAWLGRLFNGRVPPFERNADTLRALLALANANESADSSRSLLSKLESAALSDLKSSTSQPRDTLLTTLSTSLTREGTTALNTMASLSVAAGISHPTPEKLGEHLLSVAGEVAELEQTLSRVEVLSTYITTQIEAITALVKELQSEEYRPANDLAKNNLEAQRKIKVLAGRLPEMRERVASLASSAKTTGPTIESVRREEEAYLALLAEKNELDAMVRSFEGLPHDVELARQALESRREELVHISQKRDAVFEGLVERETPRKPRSRRS
ncbi:hypothetical protein OQA88_8809 [Cercophora sp. LCS_1]